MKSKDDRLRDWVVNSQIQRFHDAAKDFADNSGADNYANLTKAMLALQRARQLRPDDLERLRESKVGDLDANLDDLANDVAAQFRRAS